MNISLTFKNFDPSDHLRRYAERRFEKLGRFVNRAENVEMTAVLTVDKFRHQADVQLSGEGISIAAVEQSADMYATVDMILDKLESQLRKHVERAKERKRSGRGGIADVSTLQATKDPEAPSIDLLIIEENVEAKPMFVEEAALQLQQRDDEVVLLFINPESDQLNVIYRRKQGGFGLIATEA